MNLSILRTIMIGALFGAAIWAISMVEIYLRPTQPPACTCPATEDRP